MNLKVFIISAFLIEFSLANPFNDETTEISQTATEIIDDETFHIATNPIFKISFSVGGDWTQNYLDKSSASFKSLRDEIDVELRNIIEEDSHKELPSGTFRLVNVEPSSQENFLFVTVLMEAETEEMAVEFKDVIEYLILINNKLKLSEIPAKVHENLGMVQVTSEEIEFYEKNQGECGNGE